MLCGCLQDLVRVERAIWAARLHEKLSDELARFSFGGTGLAMNLPELAKWVQVGRHCTPPHHTQVPANTMHASRSPQHVAVAL